MGPTPPAWRPGPGTGAAGAASVWVVVLAVLLTLVPPVWGDNFPPEGHYRCGGDPLTAQFQAGAVDAAALPNRSAGTLPGSFLVVRWRGIQLQLPRTNDAGPPSFSDGKWLWSQESLDHPVFRLRQGLGQVQEFACEPLG
jgi:hypothetical protein